MPREPAGWKPAPHLQTGSEGAASEDLAEESGPVISDVEVTPQQAELAIDGFVKMLYAFLPLVTKINGCVKL
jgi:hypothetical protein